MTGGPAGSAPIPGDWRFAQEADLAGIARLSRELLGDLGEAVWIYRDRLTFCPRGCLVVDSDGDGGIGGYLISHPWRRGMPPALHEALPPIPGTADCWYLHDAGLAREQRGRGAMASALDHVEMLARGAGLNVVALVAVGGAAAYWLRMGFAAVDSAALAAKLASYGDGAVYMERRLAPL